MGFLRSTKGSIISDYFQLQEDIAGFSKGYMYDVERLNSFKNQSL